MFFYPRSKKSKNKITIAGILDNNHIQIGVARCNKTDVFLKKIGRKISEGRALKNPLCIIDIVDSDNPIKKFLELCKKYQENQINFSSKKYEPSYPAKPDYFS